MCAYKFKLPAPLQAGTFAPGVVFKPGGAGPPGERWIDNKVFLEVPVLAKESGELVAGAYTRTLFSST